MVTAVESFTAVEEYEDLYAPKQELGKDEFLQLLVTQMQYQDPLSPMDNSQMIAQLAQFSSLEQMTNVAASNQGVQAYAMIGKEITGSMVSVDGSAINETVTGIVQSVNSEGTKHFVILQTGESINVDDITNVQEPSSSPSQTEIAIATEGTQAFSLLGKHAYFPAEDTDGIVKDFDGEVVSVRKKDGRYYAEVNVGKFDDAGNPLNAMVGVQDIVKVTNM